jgi:hypothetical protein
MAVATLKSLHTYLRLLENASELKRKMPTSSSQRSVKDGLWEIFEHLLQNRDYCAAYYAFRRLERAFMASPADEEKQLRDRLDKFNAQFGGKPYGAKFFEAEDQDKTRVDAYLAAADLLEAMAFTPWSMSLNNAVSVASSNSIRSMKILARHFERFAHGEETKEEANQEIADHFLAFARQFSADSKPVQLPAA